MESKKCKYKKRGTWQNRHGRSTCTWPIPSSLDPWTPEDSTPAYHKKTMRSSPHNTQKRFKCTKNLERTLSAPTPASWRFIWSKIRSASFSYWAHFSSCECFNWAYEDRIFFIAIFRLSTMVQSKLWVATISSSHGPWPAGKKSATVLKLSPEVSKSSVNFKTFRRSSTISCFLPPTNVCLEELLLSNIQQAVKPWVGGASSPQAGSWLQIG